MYFSAIFLSNSKSPVPITIVKSEDNSVHIKLSNCICGLELFLELFGKWKSIYFKAVIKNPRLIKTCALKIKNYPKHYSLPPPLHPFVKRFILHVCSCVIWYFIYWPCHSDAKMCFLIENCYLLQYEPRNAEQGGEATQG